jgi:hypothetical protein
MFQLPVSPKKVVLILLAIIIGLSIANLWGQHYKIFWGNDEFVLKIVDKFDLDLEANNLPTWYQSSTLLLCSFLLLVIMFIRKSLKDIDTKFWGLMAAVFLYLSIDEAVSIHEQITVPLRQIVGAHGILFFAWVIPAILLIILLFTTIYKSMWRLSPTTRWSFVISGFIFVAGAVGMEMVGARYYEIFLEPVKAPNDFAYVVLTTVEEFLEMLGIALFVFSMLNYIESEAFLPIASAEESAGIPMSSIVSFSK